MIPLATAFIAAHYLPVLTQVLGNPLRTTLTFAVWAFSPVNAKNRGLTPERPNTPKPCPEACLPG